MTTAAPPVEPPTTGVLVYGAAWCEDTRRARRLLRRLGVPHRYFDVDEDLDALERATALNDGLRRTPVIELLTLVRADSQGADSQGADSHGADSQGTDSQAVDPRRAHVQALDTDTGGPERTGAEGAEGIDAADNDAPAGGGVTSQVLVEPANDALASALVDRKVLSRTDIDDRLNLQNVGDVERALRAGAGLAVLASSAQAPRLLRGPLRVLGAALLVSGTAGWCPLYQAAHVSSLNGPGDRPDEAERAAWLKPARRRTVAARTAD